MGRGGTIAEIGVALGDFSLWLLEHVRPTRFVGIDIFNGHEFESFWGRSRADVFGSGTHEAFYRRRVAGTPIEVRQGISWEQLSTFPDHTFDLIYLDADHRYWAVRQDLEAAAPKVRPGGIIVCDDYIVHDHIGNVECGVIPAVNEFVAARGYEVLAYAFGRWTFGNIAFRVS
jgi:predicted O-methyltransferase YrrM